MTALALAVVLVRPAHGDPARFAAGELLVAADNPSALVAGATGEARSADPQITAILERLGLAHARPLGAEAGAPGVVRFFALASEAAGFDALAAAQELRATGRFRAVSPNYRLKPSITLPNDPDLGLQWHVTSPGTGGIHLPEAWDIEKGSTAVEIGIMDTGVDVSHPDLASQIWTNPGEIPANGVDDDGNGFVDDVHGCDFGNADNDPSPHEVFDPIGLDIGFHGTFVAGIAAAATDNATGIAGAGWRCRILPLKVVDAAGDITLEAVTAAFLYAAANGCDVLNMSFGGPGDPGMPEYFQALVDLADAAGVVCVAAAGNDGLDTPSYPAASDKVIAVAATTESDARADFSNWGSWVDVAAPGAGIWSSICQNYLIDDVSQLFYILFFGWDGESPYMVGDGTSFAAPLTAGVCGLIRSRFPSLTPAQVAQQLVSSGDAVAYDHPIGPKVNAFRALSAPILAAAPGPASRFQLGVALPNPFASSTTIRFSLAAADRARLVLYDCAGREVRRLLDGPVEAGERAVLWNGADASGRRLGSGVYFARLESGGRSTVRKLVLAR